MGRKRASQHGLPAIFQSYCKVNLVWFISRVPKPLTCSLDVMAQKAISPIERSWKARYEMPPITVPDRLINAVDLKISHREEKGQSWGLVPGGTCFREEKCLVEGEACREKRENLSLLKYRI